MWALGPTFDLLDNDEICQSIAIANCNRQSASIKEAQTKAILQTKLTKENTAPCKLKLYSFGCMRLVLKEQLQVHWTPALKEAATAPARQKLAPWPACVTSCRRRGSLWGNVPKLGNSHAWPPKSFAFSTSSSSPAVAIIGALPAPEERH